VGTTSRLAETNPMVMSDSSESCDGFGGVGHSLVPLVPPSGMFVQLSVKNKKPVALWGCRKNNNGIGKS